MLKVPSVILVTCCVQKVVVTWLLPQDVVAWGKIREILPVLTSKHISLKTRGRIFSSCPNTSNPLKSQPPQPPTKAETSVVWGSTSRVCYFPCSVNSASRVCTGVMTGRLGWRLPWRVRFFSGVYGVVYNCSGRPHGRQVYRSFGEDQMFKGKHVCRVPME